MRIFVHDYGRYPYPWELTRALAERGHQVLYTYSEADTARATIAVPESEKNHLTVVGIRTTKPLHKSSFLKRRASEVEHGQLLAKELIKFRPDVVISANTPLDAQAVLLKASRAQGAKFIFWVQDLLGVAIQKILSHKLPVVGGAIGAHYLNLEKTLLQQSDEAVLITEDFRPFMERWSVAPQKTHVIENWAPLQDLPLVPKDNGWAAQFGLDGKTLLIYAGTMGMKHNPQLILQLAEKLRARPEVKIVMASEGSGVEWLKAQNVAHGMDNLQFIPFQPFAQMPRMMASADVLVALLEPDASTFCVPSKVLTYLCAGRPLLLSVPPDNLSAKIVAGNNAGLVSAPADVDGFVASALKLLDDPALRETLGANARRYAEAQFNIAKITNQFEALLH